MDKIDIRDLRVGDWVKIKDLKDPIKRISCIDEYLGIVDFWDGEKLIGTSINNVLPIPLTGEILEKNGFVYDDLPMSQYFEQYGLQLYYGGNGFRVNCGINASLIIDSVHQLQHALKLCGIEKEITI